MGSLLWLVLVPLVSIRCEKLNQPYKALVDFNQLPALPRCLSLL